MKLMWNLKTGTFLVLGLLLASTALLATSSPESGQMLAATKRIGQQDLWNLLRDCYSQVDIRCMQHLNPAGCREAGYAACDRTYNDGGSNQGGGGSCILKPDVECLRNCHQQCADKNSAHAKCVLGCSQKSGQEKVQCNAGCPGACGSPNCSCGTVEVCGPSLPGMGGENGTSGGGWQGGGGETGGLGKDGTFSNPFGGVMAGNNGRPPPEILSPSTGLSPGMFPASDDRVSAQPVDPVPVGGPPGRGAPSFVPPPDLAPGAVIDSRPPADDPFALPVYPAPTGGYVDERLGWNTGNVWAAGGGIGSGFAGNQGGGGNQWFLRGDGRIAPEGGGVGDDQDLRGTQEWFNPEVGLVTVTQSMTPLASLCAEPKSCGSLYCSESKCTSLHGQYKPGFFGFFASCAPNPQWCG